MGGLAKIVPTLILAWIVGGMNHANYKHGMDLGVGLG
tara:strand:- start:139 stop:249 length:111 start_codon:yes stop_codon:yes gene_type:complete